MLTDKSDGFVECIWLAHWHCHTFLSNRLGILGIWSTDFLWLEAGLIMKTFPVTDTFSRKATKIILLKHELKKYLFFYFKKKCTIRNMIRIHHSCLNCSLRCKMGRGGSSLGIFFISRVAEKALTLRINLTVTFVLRLWVVFLRGCYINFLNEWMNLQACNRHHQRGIWDVCHTWPGLSWKWGETTESSESHSRRRYPLLV